jgi:hypothetical protein
MERTKGTAMFSLQDIRKSTPAQLAELFESFDADTEVWEGDARDLLIGDASEFDEDDAAQYRLLGTCGELAAQYRGVSQ